MWNDCDTDVANTHTHHTYHTIAQRYNAHTHTLNGLKNGKCEETTQQHHYISNRLPSLMMCTEIPPLLHTDYVYSLHE